MEVLINMTTNFDKLSIFINRLKKLGIVIELFGNYPWIYLGKINGKNVTEKFEAELKEKKLENLFYGIEMPLVEVLARMEWSGIKVDLPYVKEVSSEFEKQMKIISWMFI